MTENTGNMTTTDDKSDKWTTQVANGDIAPSVVSFEKGNTR